MKVLTFVVLVLSVVSAALAASPAAGEEGGYCKGILNLPVLLTSCQKECGITSAFPLVHCNEGLKCCITQKAPPADNGTVAAAEV